MKIKKCPWTHYLVIASSVLLAWTAQANSTLSSMVFEVGPPSVLVEGQTTYNGVSINSNIEGNFFVLKNPSWPGTGESKYFGYFYSNGTIRLQGDTVEGLVPVQKSLDVAPGRPGQGGQYCDQNYFLNNASNWRDHWRDCGIWVRSGHHYNGKTHFWYHAETNCCYPASSPGADHTFFNAGYLKSNDGGKNLTTSGTRRILANQEIPIWDLRVGIDQPTVIRKGDYYYMYFGFRIGSNKMKPSVARVNINADVSKRENYEKYFDGSWQLWNHMKGQYQRVPTLAGSLSNKFGVSPAFDKARQVFLYTSSESEGVSISSSVDGVQFFGYVDDLVTSFPKNSGASGADPEKYKNVSMVGFNGGTHIRTTDDFFYLFYAYEAPGENNRRLMYRKVKIVDRQNPVHNAYTSVSRYTHKTNGDKILSSQWLPTETYDRPNDDLGYLMNSPVSNQPLRALYQCKKSSNNRTTIRYANVNSANPSTDDYACNSSEFRAALLGYAFKDSQPGTKKVIRCFKNSSWVVGFEGECDGLPAGNIKTLGYILESI